MKQKIVQVVAKLDVKIKSSVSVFNAVKKKDLMVALNAISFHVIIICSIS